MVEQNYIENLGSSPIELIFACFHSFSVWNNTSTGLDRCEDAEVENSDLNENELTFQFPIMNAYGRKNIIYELIEDSRSNFIQTKQ